MKIGDFSGKSNNLDLMKFAAAILVIYAHSYVITGTTVRLIEWPIGIVMDWSGLAVAFFFFASGFYVTKSLLNKRTGKVFWFARIGRIYPAFLVVILTTAFLVGPILSSYSLKEYLTDNSVYRYLLYLIMIPQYKLPGVFANNPYPYTVNASLWTLILEFICYIGLYSAFKLNLLEKSKLKKINILLGMGIFVIFGVKLPILYYYRAYLRPMFVFIVGMEYYIFRDSIKIEKIRTLLILTAGYFLCRYDFMDLWIICLLPYLISACAFMRKQIGEKFANLGKYSYGIYLTAFPIQQMLTSCIGKMSVILNTVLTVIISLGIAVILYHFVEKPWYAKILKLAR